jgi:hypothetical protein
MLVPTKIDQVISYTLLRVGNGVTGDRLLTEGIR